MPFSGHLDTKSTVAQCSPRIVCHMHDESERINRLPSVRVLRDGPEHQECIAYIAQSFAHTAAVYALLAAAADSRLNDRYTCIPIDLGDS